MITSSYTLEVDLVQHRQYGFELVRIQVDTIYLTAMQDIRVQGSERRTFPEDYGLCVPDHERIVDECPVGLILFYMINLALSDWVCVSGSCWDCVG